MNHWFPRRSAFIEFPKNSSGGLDEKLLLERGLPGEEITVQPDEPDARDAGDAVEGLGWVGFVEFVGLWVTYVGVAGRNR